MKTTPFLLASFAFVCVAAHATEHDQMQIETDSMTGAVIEPSEDAQPKGRLDKPLKPREHVPGVRPKANPEPHLRQGPLGGTMVETPDYMRPDETVHMPGAQNDMEAAGHE